MKLEPYFRAECDRCLLHRYVQAGDEFEARLILTSLGWTEKCVRCTETNQ